MSPKSPPAPPPAPVFLPALPNPVVGQVFRDHAAERVVEVVEVFPDRLVVAQSHGGRYEVVDRWQLLLEWLEPPHLAALRFRAQQAGGQPMRSVREALLALGPAERLVAVLRDAQGAGELLECGRRWVSTVDAERSLALALGSESDVAAARRHVRDGRSDLAKATELRVVPGQQGCAKGFLLEPSRRAEPLEQLLAGRRSGAHRSPLLLRRANRQHRYTPAEEDLLRWALQERVRLRNANALNDVDLARRQLLEATLDAVLMPAIERRLMRRPWPDPSDLALSVYGNLWPALADDPWLRERARSARAVVRLRAHLLGETLPAEAGARATTSALMHNACWGLLDLERTPQGVHDAGAVRPASVGPIHPNTSAERGGAREEQPVLPPGAAELQRWVADRAHGAHAQLERARQLLGEIRAAFVEAITSDLAHYGVYLLEFMSPVARSDGARALGVSENTVRGLFPRKGGKDDRRPHADVHALVQPFDEDVRRFGRVFPMLRFALLPSEEEVARHAAPEHVDVLRGLFGDPARWTGRGTTWPEWLLDDLAATLPPREPAWDRLALLREVVLPFLERVLEARREAGTERDLSWALAPARSREQELRDGLGWLLQGAPDGDSLRLALSLLEQSASEVAKAAGLSALDLVDLQLGLRWITPTEADGLVRALTAAAPDLPEVAARAALAPLLAPPLPAAPTSGDPAEDEGDEPAGDVQAVDEATDDDPEGADGWLEPEGRSGDDPWAELRARSASATVAWELAAEDVDPEDDR